MRTKRPFPGGERAEAIGARLKQVIDSEGAELMLAILKGKANQPLRLPAPTERKPSEKVKLGLRRLGELVSEVREQGIRVASEKHLISARETLRQASDLPSRWQRSLKDAKTRYEKLSTTQNKVELALLLGLYSASYLGGFYLGFQMPKMDVKLSKKGLPGSQITLHGAPQLSMEIGLEWMQAILEKAMTQPDLRKEEQEILGSLKKIVVQLSGGIAAGLAAKRVRLPQLKLRAPQTLPVPESVAVALNDQAYQIAEMLFLELAKSESERNQG